MNYCSRANMDTDDLKIISPAVGITARILFTLIFFLSGITHFTSMQSYIDLMPAPIPFRAFWVAISGLVELAGAAMILFKASTPKVFIPQARVPVMPAAYCPRALTAFVSRRQSRAT